MAERLKATKSIRSFAAKRFEGIANIKEDVHPRLEPKSWAERCETRRKMLWLATGLLDKDDEQFTAAVRNMLRDGMSEAELMHMQSCFEDQKDIVTAEAEMFTATHTRLMVAITRAAYRLDRDGKPVVGGEANG